MRVEKDLNNMIRWGNNISANDANWNWDGEYNTGSDYQQTRDVDL